MLRISFSGTTEDLRKEYISVLQEEHKYWTVSYLNNALSLYKQE